MSRLSALLGEQISHPIAAQSSNEAGENDNGQEEVVRGLKEELASAAAAQVRKIPYLYSNFIVELRELSFHSLTSRSLVFLLREATKCLLFVPSCCVQSPYCNHATHSPCYILSN